jgi:hypothetical protein
VIKRQGSKKISSSLWAAKADKMTVPILFGSLIFSTKEMKTITDPQGFPARKPFAPRMSITT